MSIIPNTAKAQMPFLVPIPIITVCVGTNGIFFLSILTFSDGKSSAWILAYLKSLSFTHAPCPHKGLSKKV